MYESLRSGEFFDRYKEELTPGGFRFITKAYRSSDNTVAIYPKENDVDCFFQLPNYQLTKVPKKRRYIFLLRKNSLNSLEEKGELQDGRIKIPVKLLEIWKDPYEDSEEIEEVKEVKEVEVKTDDRSDEKPAITDTEDMSESKETRVEKLKRLNQEVDEAIKKLESTLENIKSLQKKADKAEKELNETLISLGYE